MIFRLSPFPHSCAHARLPCTIQRACPNIAHPRYRRTAQFHTSRVFRSDNSLVNHYEVLQISQTASPADIKRQFFALSKLHHPDKNPNDPTASTRFVAISEAYHILSVPEKRAQYDSQLHESTRRSSYWGRSERPPEHGSYSSASYAGSRPATGLNKKRGTFRGPPPSFYKSGGYGRHGAKRAEYAHHGPNANASAGQEASQESYGDFGSGMGPGQSGQGNDVPHFDNSRHKRTHDHVYEHISARRRRTRASETPDFDGVGPMTRFMFLSGTIGLIGFFAHQLRKREEKS